MALRDVSGRAGFAAGVPVGGGVVPVGGVPVGGGVVPASGGVVLAGGGVVPAGGGVVLAGGGVAVWTWVLHIIVQDGINTNMAASAALRNVQGSPVWGHPDS